MKPNLGKKERIIRVVLGIVAIGVGMFFNLWWVWLFGLILSVTGIIGWCGMYQIFGQSCCPFSKNKEKGKDDSPNNKGCCCGK